VNSVKIKSPRAARKTRKAYHHGDLRQQLMAVTEEIILEKGVDGFTLREAARRAGVSPAAPAHHFEDARGLLTAVALLGFQEFGEALRKADAAGGSDPERRLQAQGQAYVRFALEHPARFQLMFRKERLDAASAELAAVAKQSYDVLEGAIRAATGTPSGAELLSAGELVGGPWIRAPGPGPAAPRSAGAADSHRHTAAHTSAGGAAATRRRKKTPLMRGSFWSLARV
jgi:AcrR family transcriptional regulator